MKTIILAAAAALTVGVGAGAAFAQGLPAGGYAMPHYGAAAFGNQAAAGRTASSQSGDPAQTASHGGGARTGG